MLRECLDFIIPLHEAYIHRIPKEWTAHYKRGRPHSHLGLGIPEIAFRRIELQADRYHIPDNPHVVAVPILDGRHHEYRLEKSSA